MSEIPTEGRLAGIDFGTVRIGIAITDSGQMLASPFENYNRRTEDKDALYFRQFAEQERIVAFVVGLPVHMSGDSSRMSEAATQFGKWLGEQTGLPIIWFDERYTSSLANQLMSEGSLTKKQKKKRLDMLAAQILLSSFLESDREGHSQFLPPKKL